MPAIKFPQLLLMIHFLIEKETQTDDNEKNGTTQIIAMAKTRNNTKILQIF